MVCPKRLRDELHQMLLPTQAIFSYKHTIKCWFQVRGDDENIAVVLARLA